MGHEESISGGESRFLTSEMYFPMGGMRMNGEKEKKKGPLPNQDESKRVRMVKTSFAGVWSMLKCKDSPPGRTGQFTCFDDQNHFLYTGFGISQTEEYLSDINIFDIKNRLWKPFLFTGDPIPPRINSRATISNGFLYIFGGSHECNYFNDIYSINLSTGGTKLLQTTGSAPSPRSSPVIAQYQRSIYIWGGYDGLTCPTDLHILNLDTLEWSIQHKVLLEELHHHLFKMVLWSMFMDLPKLVVLFKLI